MGVFSLESVTEAWTRSRWRTATSYRWALLLLSICRGLWSSPGWDEWKTAFNTPAGHLLASWPLTYLVMPFHLTNAPAVFHNKAEEWEFHSSTLSFLGFILLAGKTKLDKEKVEAVWAWPSPENYKQLQSFLGFANFYSSRAVKLALEKWQYWLEVAQQLFLVLMDHKKLKYPHFLPLPLSKICCVTYMELLYIGKLG